MSYYSPFTPSAPAGETAQHQTSTPAQSESGISLNINGSNVDFWQDTETDMWVHSHEDDEIFATICDDKEALAIARRGRNITEMLNCGLLPPDTYAAEDLNRCLGSLEDDEPRGANSGEGQSTIYTGFCLLALDIRGRPPLHNLDIDCRITLRDSYFASTGLVSKKERKIFFDPYLKLLEEWVAFQYKAFQSKIDKGHDVFIQNLGNTRTLLFMLDKHKPKTLSSQQKDRIVRALWMPIRFHYYRLFQWETNPKAVKSIIGQDELFGRVQWPAVWEQLCRDFYAPHYNKRKYADEALYWMKVYHEIYLDHEQNEPVNFVLDRRLLPSLKKEFYLRRQQALREK